MSNQVPDESTYKQELFCQEYAGGDNAGNATQSAIAAGYSEKTAGEIGYENLKKPHIAKRIAELQEQRLARLQITGDRILQHLSGIAFNEDCQEKDQLKANELLMKHLAMLTERREVAVTGLEVAGDILFRKENGK